MKSLFRLPRLLALTLFVALVGLNLATLPKAEAFVTNYSTSAQVVYLPFHISGTISATTAGIVKFNMPMPCTLVGAAASAQAIVGTTNTVDVKLGGVSVLSAPITIAAAGTYTEGTVSTSAIGDEGAVTIDVTIAGTSLSNITVLLTCVRK